MPLDSSRGIDGGEFRQRAMLRRLHPVKVVFLQMELNTSALLADDPAYWRLFYDVPMGAVQGRWTKLMSMNIYEMGGETGSTATFDQKVHS